MPTCQNPAIESRAANGKRQYRWACPRCSTSDGTSGDWTTKHGADDGAYYHSYAARPMTISEYRTMADGMNADATDEQATIAVERWNALYSR